jgi:nucleotide-binding universal stress UspA family protein
MKILVPLDGSKFAEAVVKPVVDMAGPARAEVHLIQVVKPAEATVNWSSQRSVEPHAVGDYTVPGMQGRGISYEVSGVAAESQAQADERTRQSARDYLRNIAHQSFPNGATEVAVTGDDPAKEILNYARQEKIDLIAIATHGRTGLARMMMGSVAGSLLQAHVAPLLMVRPDGLQ